MRRYVTAVVAAALAALVCAPADGGGKQGKGDKDRLRGTWSVVSLEGRAHERAKRKRVIAKGAPRGERASPVGLAVAVAGGPPAGRQLPARLRDPPAGPGGGAAAGGVLARRDGPVRRAGRRVRAA